MKHCGLLREILLEQHGGPHVGVEQHAEGHRIAPYAGLLGRAWQGFVAGARRAFVAQIRRQVPIMLQEGEHPLLVVRGQFLVERAAVDRLAEQLGDFPAGVVDRLAQLDWLALVRCRIVQQCAAIGIDLDLEGDAKLSAITEDGLMMAGKPRWARIPVQALVEVADLA